MATCPLSEKSCRKLSKEVGFTITKAFYRGGWTGLRACTGPSEEFPGEENWVWLERKGKKVISVEPATIYSFCKDGQWFNAVGTVPETKN